jgi:hypothetical protein
MFAAADLATDHQLGIWDSVILSAAAEAGYRLLLSEDLQEGFTWKGVTVTNPFSTPQARTADGPAWRHLNPETGTQKGFLAEQKASLAPGTAKSLGDHHRRGSGIPHDGFLSRKCSVQLRLQFEGVNAPCASA